MKKIISAVFLMVIAASPSRGQTKWAGVVTLKVTVKGSQDSVVLSYYDLVKRKLVNQRRKLDNGGVVFEDTISEPVIAGLYAGPDFKAATHSQDNSIKLLLQAGVITVKGTKTLKDAVVEGSSLSDDFKASQTEIEPYRRLMSALYGEAKESEQQKDSLRELATGKRIDSLNRVLKLDLMPGMIKKYRNSPVGAYMLSDLIYDNYRGEMDTIVILPLLSQLSPEVRHLSSTKMIEDRIDRIRKAAQMKGTPAPDFTRTDINGKAIHLSDFRGKYVLVDFWGSWCHPCRISHPHLKALYARYKDKGLEIVGVDQELQGDMEAMTKKWKNAVAEDSLTWVQVLNADGIKDFDIVKKFEVEAFPTKVLLDRQGNIVDRFVGDDPLPIDTKLQQIFE